MFAVYHIHIETFTIFWFTAAKNRRSQLVIGHSNNFFHVWKASFAASWLELICVRNFTIRLFREYLSTWIIKGNYFANFLEHIHPANAANVRFTFLWRIHRMDRQAHPRWPTCPRSSRMAVLSGGKCAAAKRPVGEPSGKRSLYHHCTGLADLNPSWSAKPIPTAGRGRRGFSSGKVCYHRHRHRYHDHHPDRHRRRHHHCHHHRHRRHHCHHHHRQHRHRLRRRHHHQHHHRHQYCHHHHRRRRRHHHPHHHHRHRHHHHRHHHHRRRHHHHHHHHHRHRHRRCHHRHRRRRHHHHKVIQSVPTENLPSTSLNFLNYRPEQSDGAAHRKVEQFSAK